MKRKLMFNNAINIDMNEQTPLTSNQKNNEIGNWKSDPDFFGQA